MAATGFDLGATGHSCSALDLLGAAKAIHPGFAYARVVELSAGVRPAYADNLPRLTWRGRSLSVNGAFRHGFLRAPALAEIVAEHLETGAAMPSALVGATRPLTCLCGRTQSRQYGIED